MCNACGFHCCASDAFEGCGCDHCDEPDCWSDVQDDDDPDVYDDPIHGPSGEPERPEPQP